MGHIHGIELDIRARSVDDNSAQAQNLRFVEPTNCSVKTMKLLLSFIALLAVNASGAEWSIRWEAAKGETVCSISFEPRSLESILSALPAGHSEANADIKDGLRPAKSTTELLGTFNGRKVIAAELEVPQTYYSRYFLIIAEVEVGKFMPIYIQQFASGVHGHGKPTFKSSESDFSVTISSKTIGTDPSEQEFRITCDLKTPPKTEQVSGGNGG